MANLTVQNYLIMLSFYIFLHVITFVSSYKCHIKRPYMKSADRKFLELCYKVKHSDMWKKCRELNSYPVRLESLQDVIFKDNKAGREFWIGPDYTEVIIGVKPEYPSFNGQRVQLNVKNAKHHVLCEQERPLRRMQPTRSLRRIFPKAVCSSVSCYVKLEKKTTFQEAIDECEVNEFYLVKLGSWAEVDFIKSFLRAPSFWFDVDDIESNASSIVQNQLEQNTTLFVICELSDLSATNHPTTQIMNTRKKRSTASITPPRKTKNVIASTEMTVTTKFNFTPLISLSSDVNSSTTVPSVTNKSPTKPSQKSKTKTTKKKPNKKNTTASVPTITSGTSTTTTQLTTPRASHSASSGFKSTTIDTTTTLSMTVTKNGEDAMTCSPTAPQMGNKPGRFECPNGKMWRTFDLTKRGENCLNTTVRSKLECMAISQQQKCPYVFYQEVESKCQLFYHELSTASINLDCANSYCYTCVKSY